MQHHRLTQGSPEWHAHRINHFNASDAPAMMGCSPYKTRTELMTELATGLAKDESAFKQRIFAAGHRFESLARQLAEEIAGEELFPVVGTNGKLSASFDGINMLEDTAWEHKSLNDRLRSVLPVDGIGDGALLPLDYRVQMEHQLIVSGAVRCLFTASKWDDEGNLVEARHAWYVADPQLHEQILAGWDQLEADLATFTPASPEAPKAVGRTPDNLPALHIEVTGAVTASNLDAYAEHALTVFKGINRKPETDQEFADAERTAKWCGDIEQRLAAVKQSVLGQTESIDSVFRTLDQLSAEARSTRLELERVVKAQKDAIKAAVVAEAQAELNQHLLELNAKLGRGVTVSVQANLADATKNKRTIASLRDSVATALATAKVEATNLANAYTRSLRLFDELAAGNEFLFADLAQLVRRDPDAIAHVVKQRIEAHQQKLADAAAEKQQADVRAYEAAQLEKVAAATPPVVERLAGAPAANADLALDGGDGGPVLTMTEINKALGLVASVELLASLGFSPVRIERNARLYRLADMPDICAGLAAHIAAVPAKLRAAA